MLSAFYFSRSCSVSSFLHFFFFTDTPPTEIYTLSLHDALPISPPDHCHDTRTADTLAVSTPGDRAERSEEHTSELQSLRHLVCRLLLEKKKHKKKNKLTQKKYTLKQICIK